MNTPILCGHPVPALVGSPGKLTGEGPQPGLLLGAVKEEAKGYTGTRGTQQFSGAPNAAHLLLGGPLAPPGLEGAWAGTHLALVAAGTVGTLSP